MSAAPQSIDHGVDAIRQILRGQLLAIGALGTLLPGAAVVALNRRD